MVNIFHKIGVLLALLLNFSFYSFAEQIPTSKNIHSKYILSGSKMIDPRAIMKITEMGDELYNRLGVNVYIYAKESYANKKFNNTKEKIEFIKSYESNITSKLSNPYVLLTLSLEDTHINLYHSSDLNGIIDKDDILNRYIIPLLASKDKNSMYAKVSAALFNGYAAIVDTIAKSKNIELKSSIGSAGTVASTIWRVFMYSIIIIGLLVYTYAVLKAKK